MRRWRHLIGIVLMIGIVIGSGLPGSPSARAQPSADGWVPTRIPWFLTSIQQRPTDPPAAIIGGSVIVEGEHLRHIAFDPRYQWAWFGSNGAVYRFDGLRGVMERSDDLGQTFVPEDGATPDSVKGRISSGEKRWLPIKLDDTVKVLMKPVAQWRTSDGAEVVAGRVSASCIPDDLDDQNIVLARYRPEQGTWSLLSLPNLPSIFPESTNPVCRHFQAIATMWVDPDDPNTIVAIRYQLVGGSGNRFDYRQGNLLWSRDGGETWMEDQTRIFLSTTPNLSLLTPLWNGERWTVLILRYQEVRLDRWTMKNELRIIQVDPRHPTTPIRAIQMPDMVRNNEGTPVWYVHKDVPITRYLVMATVPDAPQTVLIVHPATAQVYRSVDNGQTWTGPVT